LKYRIVGSTDTGTTKATNQDSFSARLYNTRVGDLVFAVVCDGMGGFEKGEVASSHVVSGFTAWMEEEFSQILEQVNSLKELDQDVVFHSWNSLIQEQNDTLVRYGTEQGIKVGTTLTALLMTDDRYYIANVGDTRVYELTNSIRKLTEDQSLVAREILAGNLTEEEAHNDPRRSVLLQCIGVLPTVLPDFYSGQTAADAVYMLCTDGFRHEITAEEMMDNIGPNAAIDQAEMRLGCDLLIELNKVRHETDNITVVLVRTFESVTTEIASKPANMGDR
jgi:serine/threonine protein phosphatase PrpC